jgi:rhodanese-related sulfurtransferase
MQPQVMPPIDMEIAGLVHAYLAGKNIGLMLGEGFAGCSRGKKGLTVRTTKERSVECDMVILSIGVRPENRLAKEAGLSIGERGGIVVNDRMQTSDPDIYAVGDAVEVIDRISGRPTQTPLAGPANKQGRIAADNACGRPSIFKGTLGTAIVKLFDMTVASTGASEKSLAARGLPYRMSYTHSGSHASYYPGADTMSVKLLYAPETGLILGAQIVGGKGVDKRIDVLATAIHGGMTIFDLEELELAYAPPYSSAKDPVNMAGFVAANIQKKDAEIVHWSDIPTLDREKNVLLDLRYAVELRKVGKMDNALHIPLHELRARLPQLDRDKTYITLCAVGMRAYVGYRILVQNGFKAKILSGGFATWQGAMNRIGK